MTAPLSPAQRRFRLLMQGYVGLFLVAGLVFLLLPGTVFSVANALSEGLGLGLAAVPPSSERFWLVLSFSLLVTLATLAFLVQRDVRRNRLLVVPILVSKITSALLYLAVFALLERHFIHLSGFAADFSLFVLTLVFYRQAWPRKDR